MSKAIQLNVFIITGLVAKLKGCLDENHFDPVLLEQLTFLFRYSKDPFHIHLFIRADGINHLSKLLGKKKQTLQATELILKAIYAFVLIGNNEKVLAYQAGCIAEIEESCRYLINDDIRTLAIYILLEISDIDTKNPLRLEIYDKISRCIIRLISITSPFTELTAIHMCLAFFQNKQRKFILLQMSTKNYWLNFLNIELLRVLMTLDGDREAVRVEVSQCFLAITYTLLVHMFIYRYIFYFISVHMSICVCVRVC